MGLIKKLAIFVVAVSFLTFVAFFGRLPAFRNTPIGALHRVLWVHIPKGLAGVDRLVTGGRLIPGVTRFGNYMLYSKHYTVLIIFLGLMTGSVYMFVPPTWQYLTPIQKWLVLFLVPPPYILTYLCQVSSPNSPHLISAANINEQLQQYPYDHINYHPNNICKTCELPKPARSKHCSLCGTCVARCDHHCVWVNNCVGRGNYKYFLGLLLSTGITIAYGCYLAYATLMPEIYWHFENYPYWFVSQSSGQEDFVSRIVDGLTYALDVLQTGLIVGGISRAGVGLLALMTWPLPLGLFAYHLYLIWAGMTTNETAKWEDWKEDIADGVVFAAEVKQPHEEGRAEPSRWPHKPKQFLVRTRDGKPPRAVADVIKERVVKDTWKQIWQLRDVDNIYDLGFWSNLAEVLVN